MEILFAIDLVSERIWFLLSPQDFMNCREVHPAWKDVLDQEYLLKQIYSQAVTSVKNQLVSAVTFHKWSQSKEQICSRQGFWKDLQKKLSLAELKLFVCLFAQLLVRNLH